MTDQPLDAEALTKDILDRLVKETWIKQYAFTDGKGYNIAWTPHGGMTAMAMKEWRKKLALGDGDERPLILDMVAHGLMPHPTSNATTINAAFKHYVQSGLAVRATFKPNIGCDIEWTDLGQNFIKNYASLVDALKISADEDRLIMFFTLMECWAPNWDTPTNLRS